jgi:hypothetical protein
VIWTLYSFFWVILRLLNFVWWRFGTLSSGFIGGISLHHLWRWNWQCPETSAYKIQTPENRPKVRIKEFWNISWQFSQMAAIGKINISFTRTVLTDRSQYCLELWVMLGFQRILEWTYFLRNYLNMIIVSWDVIIECCVWQPINQVSVFIARLEIRLMKRCKSVYLSVNSTNF